MKRWRANSSGLFFKAETGLWRVISLSASLLLASVITRDLWLLDNRLFSNDARRDSDEEIELQRRSDHEHIEIG